MSFNDYEQAASGISFDDDDSAGDGLVRIIGMVFLWLFILPWFGALTVLAWWPVIELARWIY